jgi:outer membrane lipoprotein carrier protein
MGRAALLAPGLVAGLLVLATARPAAAAPADDCARRVAERVQRHYDGVRDLRARFVQHTARVALGSQGAAELEARGEVIFAKPGRMRWSYESPAPSLVVSDGKTLWIHDPEAQEVQELTLGPGFLSGAALQFLLGEGRLLDEYAVSARGCSGPEVELVLEPRHDTHYERLELRVDPKSGAVRETAVVDLLGNRTVVTLEQVRLNTGPEAGLFRFVAPPGTRVLSVPPSAP